MRYEPNRNRIYQILFGAQVSASDIAMFEYEFEESLEDSNHWYDNSFTLLGYMYGKERWKCFTNVVESNRSSKYFHLEHIATLAFDGVDYEVEYAVCSWGVINDFYRCEFYADVINDIPAYRERFCKNLKELLY